MRRMRSRKRTYRKGGKKNRPKRRSKGKTIRSRSLRKAFSKAVRNVIKWSASPTQVDRITTGENAGAIAENTCAYKTYTLGNYSDVSDLFNDYYEKTTSATKTQIDLGDTTAAAVSEHAYLNIHQYWSLIQIRNNTNNTVNVQVCKWKCIKNSAFSPLDLFTNGMDKHGKADSGWESEIHWNLWDSFEFGRFFKITAKRYIQLKPGDEFKFRIAMRRKSVRIHDYLAGTSSQVYQANQSVGATIKFWGGIGEGTVTADSGFMAVEDAISIIRTVSKRYNFAMPQDVSVWTNTTSGLGTTLQEIQRHDPAVET